MRTSGGPSESPGPVDPLAAAYELAATARTERERYKALEAIRGATRLLLAGDLDEEQRALLDRNIAEAAEAFLTSSTFDNRTRALQGLREAIRHRLDAVPAPGPIEVPLTVSLADGSPVPGTDPGTVPMTTEQYSQEVVRAAGYSPDLVVVSPADALAIQLLVMADGDHYAFSQQLPSFVVTTAVADGEGFVADSSALGTLFLGPFAFAAFEENAGSTNTSTVRAESSGLFVVQRPDAAASLSGAS
jgi:hypothetical protein